MQAALKTRSSVKGWLKNAEKKCHALIEKLPDVDEDVFRSAIATFDERLKSYDEAQKAVEALTDEADLDEMIEAALDYRDEVEEAKMKLITEWKKAHPPPPQSPQTSELLSSPRSENGHMQMNNGPPPPNIKLPKIELPRFNGDVLKFNAFWQQFAACVDELDIPTVTKFNYLSGVLRGDAKSALEGIPITEENYQTAKEILHQKFGRKELVVFAHVQELLALSPSKDKLSHMYDKLVANVRSLEGLGVTPEQFGIILTPIIVSRLPEEVRMEWSRDCVKKEGDLEYLMKFLDKEISRRERCVAFGSLGPDKEVERKKLQKPQGSRGSATALLNAQGSKCQICNNKHETSKCKKYTDLNQEGRWELVKRMKLCFNCLNVGHRSLRCRARRCSVCSRCHHDTLHIDNYGSTPSSEPAPNPTRTGTENTVQNTDVNLLTVNKNVTFLPTARVKVQGRDGSWLEATLLFDSGADRSYISSSLVGKVSPRFVKTTDGSFSTFGGRSKVSKSKMYSLSVKGRAEQAVEIQVAEVPVICLPLVRPSVAKDVIDSLDVELADEFKSEASDLVIDILIGQDLFWSLMMDSIKRVPDSMITAQESVFGWVLSGSQGQGRAHFEDAGFSLLSISPDSLKAVNGKRRRRRRKRRNQKKKASQIGCTGVPPGAWQGNKVDRSFPDASPCLLDMKGVVRPPKSPDGTGGFYRGAGRAKPAIPSV